MKSRKLGKSGIEASVVGFGSWAIGGWMWGGLTDENEAVEAIHAAIDSGMNLIDTAPMYGFGASEEIVGKAIYDRRDKVVLATKCGLIWHEGRGDFHCFTDEKHPSKDGKFKISRCLAPDVIRYEVEQSLKRLKTDYIDLLQTHWQDSTTPISETMETLLRMKEEGKIRAIGCCNTDLSQISQYNATDELDSDQELYSMLDRSPEKEIFPYTKEQGIAFLAYSSLGQGLLTGKIGPERVFNDGDQRNHKPRFSVENRQRVKKMLEVFQPIADKHCVTLGQLAIGWTVAQRGCTHALVGARTVHQVLENTGGGNLQLDDGDLGIMNSTIDCMGKDIP
jgi:methylglyoxal reductase